MNDRYHISFEQRAMGLLEFLECDFAESDKNIQLEAIRVELESAYDLGFEEGYRDGSTDTLLETR